jgi:hypothetical protein
VLLLGDVPSITIYLVVRWARIANCAGGYAPRDAVSSAENLCARWLAPVVPFYSALDRSPKDCGHENDKGCSWAVVGLSEIMPSQAVKSVKNVKCAHILSEARQLQSLGSLVCY